MTKFCHTDQIIRRMITIMIISVRLTKALIQANKALSAYKIVTDKKSWYKKKKKERKVVARAVNITTPCSSKASKHTRTHIVYWPRKHCQHTRTTGYIKESSVISPAPSPPPPPTPPPPPRKYQTHNYVFLTLRVH